MFEHSPEDESEQHSPAERTKDRPRLRRPPWAVVIVIGILIASVIVWLTVFSPRNEAARSQVLPTGVTDQINSFSVYAPKAGSSTDFTVQQDSVSYTDGVLLFAMRNPINITVTITEQRTPAGYDSSKLQVTQRYSTEYGNALVTDNPDRTTGALFTADHTWILINAPTPIGLDAMKELINSFKPVLHT